MKKRTMKLLSLLLAFAMMLSLAPLSVFAADGEDGEGSAVVAEEPAEDPAEPEEPGEEDPTTGAVVAVVYGDAFEAALLAVEQDYNLLADEVVGTAFGGALNPSNYKGRTISKLQDISGDTTPQAIFGLVDENGNETELTSVSDPKGSEYVEVIGERADLLADALDGIRANNFAVYKADALEPGTYTLKLKYMAEPYGLRNTDLLTQKVTVEAGKTTIAGGDAIEVRGHANETVQIDTGKTERKAVGGHWEGWKYVIDYEEVPVYEDVTTTYDYTLNFPGFFLRKETRQFTFTTTDVTGQPVAGAEFVAVNRDELLGLLNPVIGVGKEVFTTVIKNLGDPEVFSFEELVRLHANLLKQSDQGYIAIDPEAVYGILQAYLALLTDADIVGQFITYDENGGFAGLAQPLPAILSATSDENGLVTFSDSSNITLTWLIQILLDFGVGTLNTLAGDNALFGFITPLLQMVQLVMDPDSVDVDSLTSESFIDLVRNIPGISENTIVNGILNAASWAGGWIDGILTADTKRNIVNWIHETLYDPVMNYIYGMLQNYNIVGEKISNGNYLLFQYKTPETYARNPLVYTLNIKWTEPDNLYVTVADLGLAGPYIAEGFYEFIRNTTFEGPIAKTLGVTSFNYAVASKLLTGQIDLTKAANQQVQGAFSAYMADALYKALGLDVLFKSKLLFMEGLNDYLVENRNAATNLQAYVDAQAKKAKAVYTGTVNEDWVFYTLDDSLTTTATKLIDKSTADIAEAMPAGSAKQAGVKDTGSAVSAIVKKIGTRVEETTAKLLSPIKNAVSNIFNGIKNAVTGLFGNLGNLGNLFGSNNADA